MTYEEFDKYMEYLITEAHSSGWYQGKMEALAEVDLAFSEDDATVQIQAMDKILDSKRREDLMVLNGQAIKGRRTWKRNLLEAYKEAIDASQDDNR